MLLKLRSVVFALTCASTLLLSAGANAVGPKPAQGNPQVVNPSVVESSEAQFDASDSSFDKFGVRTWAITHEGPGPTGVEATHISGLSEDGQVIGKIRLQTDTKGTPSMRVEAPFLPGAAEALVDLRQQEWLAAFVADSGEFAPSDLAKARPGDPDPNACLIKTIAAGAAYAAAVASCGTVVGCAAGVSSLGIAIYEMERACNPPENPFCNPGTAAPCPCGYNQCNGHPAVGVKICNPAGTAYSSCLACSGAPTCEDPGACPTIGIQDTSNWCAENECEGVAGQRTCNSDLQWDPCTCGPYTPNNNCDFEGQTSPAACANFSCPLGTTATKVCVADPLDSNLTWSDCFCDDPDSGSEGEQEPPHEDDPGPWQDNCELGPDACDTVVSGRRLCRTCSVTDVSSGACLLWHPWKPC